MRVSLSCFVNITSKVCIEAVAGREGQLPLLSAHPFIHPFLHCRTLSQMSLHTLWQQSRILKFFSKKKRVWAPQQTWWVKAYRTCAVAVGWMIHAVGHEMVWSLGYGCFSYILHVFQACRTFHVPYMTTANTLSINIKTFQFFFNFAHYLAHPAVASMDQYALNTRTFSVSHKHTWIYVLLSPPCVFLNHCVVG